MPKLFVQTLWFLSLTHFSPWSQDFYILGSKVEERVTTDSGKSGYGVLCPIPGEAIPRVNFTNEPLQLVDGAVPVLLRRGTFRWLCLTMCSCGFLFVDVSLKMITIINHNHKNNYCVLNVLQDNHLGVTWETSDILKPLVYISEYPWSWFRSSSGVQYFYKESLYHVAILNSCLP